MASEENSTIAVLRHQRSRSDSLESPVVFNKTHALLMDLVREGRVQALRLDHTDGLYNPRAYFEALQRSFASAVDASAGNRGPDDRARPMPLLIEKILEPGEPLPASWAVDGTTGYDFCAATIGLFVDPASEHTLRHSMRDHRRSASVLGHAQQCKLATCATAASELNMLRERSSDRGEERCGGTAR